MRRKSAKNKGRGGASNTATSDTTQKATTAPSTAQTKSPSELKPLTFEREKMFFDFHPVHFVDDVINAVNEYACNAMDDVEAALQQRWGTEGAEFVPKAADHILALLQKSIDKNFDKWELYVLQNIFVVPEGMDPDPYQTSKNTDKVAQEQVDKLNEDLRKLRERREAARYVSGTLKRRIEEMDAYLERVKRQGAMFDVFKGETEEDQLPSLPERIAELCEKRDQILEATKEAIELKKKIAIKNNDDSSTDINDTNEEETPAKSTSTSTTSSSSSGGTSSSSPSSSLDPKAVFEAHKAGLKANASDLANVQQMLAPASPVRTKSSQQE